MPTEQAAPGGHRAGRGRRRRPPGTVLGLLGLVGLASAMTFVLYAVLQSRVRSGSDNALRLASILPYVGIDSTYTLARALGIAALAFAYLAVVLGLLLGARGRAATPLTAGLHRQAGLLTVALAAAHAVVPFASVDPPYGGWESQFVPFAQPWQWGTAATNAESVGIIAFYLGVVAGPTFYLAARWPRGWRVVHRAAALLYVLCVLHAFFLGSDFLARGPARVALLASQVPLLYLLSQRIVAAIGPDRARLRPAVTGIGLAGCAGLITFAVMVATGAVDGGIQL